MLSSYKSHLVAKNVVMPPSRAYTPEFPLIVIGFKRSSIPKLLLRKTDTFFRA